MWDVEGRRYFDALSAYSALNFGHRHPGLVAAAEAQLGRLTLTSRAFHSDQLGPFCAELATFCAKPRVLPMNTGAEGVETAIKLARKWGHDVRGVAEPKIVVCAGNFHGRTTTIISFSDDPLARDGFGPYTPGFVAVPYGDAAALREALRDEDVVAFLVEPIQGEAGVVIPPEGYLSEVRAACTEAGVLMIADEIQSGLGRAGARFACDHEDVVPDLYILGKALGGGILPLSAVVGDDEVLGVLRPGEHGSTFGGNPLACAVGREVLRLLDDRLIADSAALGSAARRAPRALRHGAPARAVARHRHRRVGARRLRAAARARRPVQGHPRDDAARRAAAHRQRRGARLGARACRGRAARLARSASCSVRAGARTGRWDRRGRHLLGGVLSVAGRLPADRIGFGAFAHRALGRTAAAGR